MLSILRKSKWFKLSQETKYKKAFDNMNENNRGVFQENKKIEESVEDLVCKYEDEIKQVEMKYDQLLQAQFKKRRENVDNNKEKIPNFWLNALSNHYMFKEFISSSDCEVLKNLIDIAYQKLDDGNSFKLVFTFNSNSFFSNEVIEKEYKVNNEHLIVEIKSTQINWLQKDVAYVKVEKKMKNKKTGEIQNRTVEQPKKSFFNFFCTVRIPTPEDIGELDFEDEKELGHYLDSEFEYGMEFVEEFIPHVTDYYLGFKTETDELSSYMESHSKAHKESI
mmetsp:Transcript_20328/g.21116  ORF Transcript_20328/g.21116 Transcript_20328/m.21116 type:complete len:278 (+) Transcript_20328:13-846(+)